MGGSSKQTIGYKYFGGMMLAIGNRIEKLIDINPDERGWIMTPEQKRILDSGDSQVIINNPDLFGGDNQEGGMIGALKVYTGKNDQLPDEYLVNQINNDISGYPNLSYLVFSGIEYKKIIDWMPPIPTNSRSLSRGFYWCSMSGMLKDMMLWVKRTRIKNDGSRQWFEYSYRENKKIIVCEIGGIVVNEESPDFDGRPFVANLKAFNHDIYNGNDNKYIGADHNIHFIDYNLEFIFNNVISGTLQSQFSTPPTEVDISQRIVINGFGKGFIIANFKVSTFGEKKISFFGDVLSILSENFTEEHDNNPAITEYSVLFSSGVDFGVDIKTTGYYKNGDNYFFSNSCISSLSKPFKTANYYNESDNPDINPIHKIREILTDNEAMGKDESKINDSNFMICADRIWDEGLGISWSLNEKSCKDALDELLYHIEAGLRINRETGKYEVILFRDDLLDIENSIKFNESNIKSIEFDISNLEDSISSINVSYYDRELIKDSSFLLYENGLERTRGYSISENVDFPYFMNRRNAEVVGNWKLKQLSTPTWKGSFKTGIDQSRKINKYDVILLSWSSKNIVDLPVRVMNINLGDGINNTVTFDFVEVIPYSNIYYSDTSVDEKVNDRLPPQHNLNLAFEMPYFESVQRFGQSQVDLELSSNPEIGYLMASAAKPQNNSLNAQLYTDKATGVYTNMSKVGVVDYCPALYIDQIIGFTDTVFKVKDIDSVSINGVTRFTGATSGTWIILNNEIMVYESFNPELMQITVKRGALDTVPHKHTSGAIFFSDEFSGIDNNQYVQSEVVKYQVLTSTPSALEQLELGNTKEVEFKSRAIRPYPPANVKINGNYYPETIVISNDIVLNWVDRNRTQQTGGDIIGWYDGDLTIEDGVTYSIEVSSENIVLFSQSNIDKNTITVSKELFVPNKSNKIKLWSFRENFDSYQFFEHNVFIESVSLILSATVSNDKVVGSTVPQANIIVNVDESLSANIKFDGSSIKGKTLPNSTITIEVNE